MGKKDETTTSMTRDDRGAALDFLAEIHGGDAVPPLAFVHRKAVEFGLAQPDSLPTPAEYLKNDGGARDQWRLEFGRRVVTDLWERELKRERALERTDPERAQREFGRLAANERRLYILGRVRRAFLEGTDQMDPPAGDVFDSRTASAANRRGMLESRQIDGKPLGVVRDEAVDFVFGLVIAPLERMGLTGAAGSVRGWSDSIKTWLKDFERGPWLDEANRDLEQRGVAPGPRYIPAGERGAGNRRDAQRMFERIDGYARASEHVAARGGNWLDRGQVEAVRRLGPQAVVGGWDPHEDARDTAARWRFRREVVGDALGRFGGSVGSAVYGILDRTWRNAELGEAQSRKTGEKAHARVVDAWETSDRQRLHQTAAPEPPRPEPPRPEPAQQGRAFRGALRDMAVRWATEQKARPGLTERERDAYDEAATRTHAWVRGLDERQLARLHQELLGQPLDERGPVVTDAFVTTLKPGGFPILYELAASGRVAGLPRLQRPAHEPAAVVAAVEQAQQRLAPGMQLGLGL